jgi:transmembrane sensor
MSMSESGERRKIMDEAAIWLMRMEHDASPQTHAEFDRWIRQGALHAREYLLAKATWTNLHGLDSSLRLNGPDGSEPVIPFPEQKTISFPDSTTRNRRTRRLATVAASVVLVAGAALAAAFWPLGSQSYTTATGTQESIQLADGSVIHLNTGSRARVEFTDRVRKVRLIEGEALFSVAHDANRPFVVVTDNARVRAVGTQFNVYRHGAAATRVAVVEGIVQVISPDSDVRLVAGEEVRVERGDIVKPPVSNVQRAVAWRARRLMFDDVDGARVEDIAREFNRYNRVQIHVEGDMIRARRMGGTFDADDPAPFIGFLSKDPDIIIEESSSRISIRPRASH